MQDLQPASPQPADAPKITRVLGVRSGTARSPKLRQLKSQDLGTRGGLCSLGETRRRRCGRSVAAASAGSALENLPWAEASDRPAGWSIGSGRGSPAVGRARSFRTAESGGLGGPPVVDHTEHDQDGHDSGGDEGADGGDPGDRADRRPGVGGQEQTAQRLALEQAVALGGDPVGGGLQRVDLGLARRRPPPR